MNKPLSSTKKITDLMIGFRFDQAVAELFPEYSRTQIKKWIQAGKVSLDGVVVMKPREKVYPDQEVILIAEESLLGVEPIAQNIRLQIIEEDEDILVINKPAGLVVHPGAGNTQGTLLNALLHHLPSLESLPRAGIVHRLDKETSGLLVVAKTLEAYETLTAAFKAREVTREYEAIVTGVMTAGMTIDAPIGRHPNRRTKMAVLPEGKEAITQVRVVERFRQHSHLKIRLETGRTHQIRVHLAYKKYPIVGDIVYGGRPRPPAQASPELRDAITSFPRQALHAVYLSFIHPSTGEEVGWRVPLASEMIQLLALLRQDNRQSTDER